MAMVGFWFGPLRADVRKTFLLVQNANMEPDLAMGGSCSRIRIPSANQPPRFLMVGNFQVNGF